MKHSVFLLGLTTLLLYSCAPPPTPTIAPSATPTRVIVLVCPIRFMVGASIPITPTGDTVILGGRPYKVTVLHAEDIAEELVGKPCGRIPGSIRVPLYSSVTNGQEEIPVPEEAVALMEKYPILEARYYYTSGDEVENALTWYEEILPQEGFEVERVAGMNALRFSAGTWYYVLYVVYAEGETRLFFLTARNK